MQPEGQHYMQGQYHQGGLPMGMNGANKLPGIGGLPKNPML